jgi:hypothetical protein
VPKLTQTGYDNWNDGLFFLTLYLEVPLQSYAQLFRVREDIQGRLLNVLKPMIDAYQHFRAVGVCIVPVDEAPSNWREHAKVWLRGEGVTNQGRVRSDNIAARQYDGLLFRSQEEINLYRALKSPGVSFAPLPVFVRGGKNYRRIEPDFIVVKDGMVAVIEADGDTVHQESPVEAHDRTTITAAFWSAIAASFAALFSFITMMIQRRNLLESVRPDLILIGWDRRRESPDTG